MNNGKTTFLKNCYNNVNALGGKKKCVPTAHFNPIYALFPIFPTSILFFGVRKRGRNGKQIIRGLKWIKAEKILLRESGWYGMARTAIIGSRGGMWHRA